MVSQDIESIRESIGRDEERMKYVHTNIVARDWRRLAGFYREVFGCTPVTTEMDLSGHWLDKVTGIEGARIRGINLRLPGHGENGPTIEIFQYDDQPESPETAPNRPGLGHLAFAVEDVEAVKEAVLKAGGGMRARWPVPKFITNKPHEPNRPPITPTHPNYHTPSTSS